MKKISFIARNKNAMELFDPPIPAKNIIPDWYKRQNKYSGGNKTIDGGLLNHTVKACMPVFDMITAGYMITTPADIYFSTDNNGEFTTSWSVDYEQKLIEHHGQIQYDQLSIPEEYYPVGLKFINPWIIKTPPGYSCLFIHPQHRDDLPFSTLSAIVDTDKHPIPVNFPFFMRKDFNGIIKTGTPIVQVIPFKRESWNSEVSYDDGSMYSIWLKSKRQIGNIYKTFFRSQKEWK